VLETIAHLHSKAEAHCEQPSEHAVRRLHRDHRIAPGGQQRSETQHPARSRLAATDVAHHEAHAELICEVAVRPQLDVITEPAGLLMRVRVAAQPGEQRNVVDDGSLCLVQLEILRYAEGQHARAQHMLHRLPEPEIRGQRHGRHKFGEPHFRPPERGHGYRVIPCTRHARRVRIEVCPDEPGRRSMSAVDATLR
jgi:hypothetical protein